MPAAIVSGLLFEGKKASKNRPAKKRALQLKKNRDETGIFTMQHFMPASIAVPSLLIVK